MMPSCLPEPIDYEKAEAALQSGYSAGAKQYRGDDEIEVTTPHHRHVTAILSRLSASFNRPISVLDVGCGTGRYFYCLENVDTLVGLDITPEMLSAARNPIYADRVSARETRLIRGNAFFAEFPRRSFDLIYSLGMFGHGCPVTVEVCNKFYEWLAPGGQLFFDVVDLGGLPWNVRFKKRIRRAIYPFLPRGLQQRIRARQNGTPFLALTARELETILRASRFSRFTVRSEVCDSPLWRGRHLECRAEVPRA
jgi:SAM-dependent methyltransferase